ncbi:hypothetical protein NUW54_g11933 [Trametes sanguinea]|uniref:Uncharacterized protein n=1 Tax=Trametes sanguinea TaxID=158606 RepID=A0ACC1N5V3_9APHY|nr:hypothetical protein NUW54_g11933 [Trametes sanguinea]
MSQLSDSHTYPHLLVRQTVRRRKPHAPSVKRLIPSTLTDPCRMSRADVLLCPKVAALICQHLSPGSLPIEAEHDKDILNTRREGREALASLARVCRGVSSLALDALWACIDDFRDLLSVFEVYSPTKSMFTDVFTDTEWLRFQGYALRIRELHAGELDRVHSTVWITLTRRSLQGPLLPHLQRLTGLNLTSESLPYTMLFSPTIRHLDLKVDAAAEQGIIRMVLQELQPALASVRTLVVTEPAWYLRSTAPAVKFWKCTQLRTLKVMRSIPITREMLDSLASMENLHTLHLHIKSMPSYSQNENPTGFSKLNDLALWGRLTDVCAFLTATKPPDLQVLAIEIRRLCDDTRGGHGGAAALCSLDTVYASLAPSLRHFSAVLRCDCDDIYHFLDSEKVLVPLSAFRELRDVSFVFEGSKFHLSDAALAELPDEVVRRAVGVLRKHEGGIDLVTIILSFTERLVVHHVVVVL